MIKIPELQFEDVYEFKRPLLIGTIRFKKVDTLPSSPVHDYYLYWHNTDETFYFYDQDLGAFIDVSNAGGSYVLPDLDDIDISGLSDGEILQYNATSEKWENVTPPSGGSVPTFQMLSIDPPQESFTLQVGAYYLLNLGTDSSRSFVFSTIINNIFNFSNSINLIVRFVWNGGDETSGQLCQFDLDYKTNGEVISSPASVHTELTYPAGNNNQFRELVYTISGGTLQAGDTISVRLERHRLDSGTVDGSYNLAIHSARLEQ